MDRTDSKIDTYLTPSFSRCVRFELIDKDGSRVIAGRWLCTDCGTTSHRLAPNGRCGCGSGRVMGEGFETAVDAAEFAQKLWPGMNQDPDRTGAGWDVQIAGIK